MHNNPEPGLEQRILAWLNGLVNLTISGADSVSTEKLAAYADMLVKDGFVSAAFTSDSLHDAAQGARFFPAYDDIRRKLAAWWSANRPAIARSLPGPGMPEMDPSDRSWIDFWHRRRAELFAQQDGFKWGTRERDLENLGSLIRSHSPKAWAYVSGEKPNIPRAPTEAEAAYVANLLRPKAATPRSATPDAPPPEPFRNVAAKGEPLAKMREARQLASVKGTF
jgi:hypothetical protein